MTGGWWCCCAADCVVLEDDFNRTDNTDIGADWTEVTGDSEIVSGELMIPAASAGVVATVAGTGAGPSDPRMKVTVTCKDQQPAKTYWAIVNYRTGPESYFAAELECLAAGVAWIRAISVSAGTRSVLMEREITYIAGNDASLVACRTLEGIYATSDPSVAAWDCVSDNGGRQAGLGNDSAASDVEFDDFIFLKGEAGGMRCFTCECECEGHCLPDTLTLTFNATGACACIDTTTITLTLDDSDEIKWSGSGTISSLDDCSTTDTAQFVFYCADDPWDFILENTNSYPGGEGWSTDGLGNDVASPSAYTCDPVSITFPSNVDDAFTFTMSPPCPVAGCDCSFTITITE